MHPGSWQAAVAAPFPPTRTDASPKHQNDSAKHPTATQKLQHLQGEVNELKRKELELRSLLSEVAGSAADSYVTKIESLRQEDLPNQRVFQLVQELSYIQRTKAFAQCLQELQGVLKHLERQLRAVERAANAGDLNSFLTAVSEAVASHNTVGENCEKLAQLPVSGLPRLLSQHADSAVGRATADQEKLLASLRQILQKQLKVLGWPPSLASPTMSSPSQSTGSHLVEASGSWKGFDSADQEAVDWLVRLMAALVALQRSIQRSSFELGLDSKAEEPPALWAVEELAAPLAERLGHHFVGNPNTDRIDHPEWLFETVKRLASRLAPQLTVLTQTLAAHELQRAYHLPFEFVRALRTGLQGILKQHTLPRLLAARQPGLWLNFVEKAVAFERQLAPLRGISLLRSAGDEAPELWRQGSCVAVICANEGFREAWWEALRSEASRQLDDILALPDTWSPAHLAWEASGSQDWDDLNSNADKRASEAWQSEFWAPSATEATLTLVTQLAKTAAWLQDDVVPDFARAVPQESLRQLRKHISSELKRLEDFREELSAEGAQKIGAMLCGAHHLEHALREANGHLLLLESSGEDGAAGPSMLSLEADAFGAVKQRGSLRLSKIIIDSFRQAATSYFRKSNIQSFAAPYSPDYREGLLSPGLRKGIDELHANLSKLSQVLDAVLFKDMWKGVAAALNRLLFNALITEARFSPQGAQQLAADVAAILDVFLRFTNKPGTHFREITEAARLLSADEATASEAAWQLRSGPPDQMAAVLQPLGIARLTPQQVAHVLAQRL